MKTKRKKKQFVCQECGNNRWQTIKKTQVTRVIRCRNCGNIIETPVKHPRSYKIFDVKKKSLI